VLNKDGYLNIVGRIKDLIIRGGENVYPKELEDYLL
jgi:fatty-acyl-CoA synthase